MANNNYLNKIRIGSEDVDIHDIRNLAASGTDGGAALKTGAIPFGVVDSTSTATAFTATVDGITELTDGTCVLLKNSVITSAAGFTIDINNLGAHPVFNNLSAATAETTIFNVNYTMLFVYDSTRVVGESTGAWCCYRGYDSNTNTIGYQLRSNSYTKDMADRTYRYRILFSSADNSKWVPSNTSTSTSATASKTVCQTPINPFGEIVYYGTTASVAAGSRPAAANLWQQYTLALGYSFNKTGAALTLTSWEPVYVKCAPQANGSAIIDSTTPYVQSLPSTDDGKIYIFLGVAYSATNIELLMNHPVYYYKGGAIRLWANTADTTLGTLNTNNTTAQTTSSSESFGGTINLHKVSKTGSYNDLLNKPTIPDDSNLVHKTGNEIINGIKSFKDNINLGGVSKSEIIQHVPELITGNTLQFDWISIHADLTEDDLTLQQALDARNNVQADWNQTTTTAADYIKNKPTIPEAQIQANWNETDPTNIAYIQNAPLDVKKGDGLVYGIEIDNERVFINGENRFSVGGNTSNSNYICWDTSGDVGLTLVSDSEGMTLHSGAGVSLTTTGNNKFTYNNKEVAVKDDIPTNVSAFTNDAGYLTSYTETDPTVPAWAKASTKPTYTAAEVGALPDTTVIPDAPGTLNTNNSTAQTVSSSESLSGTINLHKISKSGNYNDLLNKPSIPVDSDLVHTTGDEQISGNKTFRANGNIRLQSGWNQIYNEDDSESLQQALNQRNNVQSDWNATTGDAVILNKPTIPTVNNSTITIQKNSSTVDSFTLNQSSNKTINITVPTTASDVSALPASTKYGASLSVSIDSTTYVVTAQLKDQDGNNLGTAQTIDLPLESVVVSGSYDSATKKVILTLKDGSTIDFSIADLVSGLQTEITSTNKLSADLVEDGTTNKVYTATEKTKLSGIASGAEVNVQSNWNETNSSSDAYIQNKPSIPSKTSDLTNDSNFISTSSTSGLIKNDGTIDTNEYLTDPDVFITSNANGHDYVDLNLPSGTLWATMNVGASTTSDYGNYYMWGKTTPYDETDTPYGGSEYHLGLQNDVASQEWGGSWHMPTEEQITELIQYTKYERVSGNAYSKYISYEDPTKYIIIPHSGLYASSQPASTDPNSSGINGNAFLWSNTNLVEDTSNSNAKFLSIGSNMISTMNRSYGLTIRPVLDGNKVKNQNNLYIKPNWNQSYSSAPDYILNKPQIYGSPGVNTSVASPLLYTGYANWYYDSTGIKYQSQNGSTSVIGNATLSLGNATASGVSGNKQGKLVLYSTGTYSNTLNSTNLTANRTLSLPNEDGTLATQAYVTSSMPTVNNGTLSISGPSGGSTVTTDVFHANQSGDSLIAFSPGTNTTINVNSSTRTITIGTTAEPNVQSNWNETDTSSDAYILNKPTIPQVLDNPQGTETDAAPSVRYVENIRAEVDFRQHVDGTSIDVSADDELYVKSLNADKLTNGTNNKVFTSAEQLKLAGIDVGAQVNVQSDWNETNVLSDAYILNKPTIPDITGKADKVTGAVNGNFAALDSNGNLVDSGHKHTDYSVVTFRTWT